MLFRAANAIKTFSPVMLRASLVGRGMAQAAKKNSGGASSSRVKFQPTGFRVPEEGKLKTVREEGGNRHFITLYYTRLYSRNLHFFQIFSLKIYQKLTNLLKKLMLPFKLTSVTNSALNM